MCVLFFFKQKTAYEMRISDWSSDVCSSDLQFKAAQSHVLAAAIEAKTRFTQKEDRDRFIERAKETVAKRIEVGAPVPAARFEQQRQNEATRIAREDLTLRQQ